MKHYLVQIGENRPTDFDIGPFDQYLRERGVRDLVAGHGQLFALIQCNEERHRLYIGLAWRLHPDDQVLVTELSADWHPFIHAASAWRISAGSRDASSSMKSSKPEHSNGRMFVGASSIFPAGVKNRSSATNKEISS